MVPAVRRRRRRARRKRAVAVTAATAARWAPAAVVATAEMQPRKPGPPRAATAVTAVAREVLAVPAARATTATATMAATGRWCTGTDCRDCRASRRNLEDAVRRWRWSFGCSATSRCWSMAGASMSVMRASGVCWCRWWSTSIVRCRPISSSTGCGPMSHRTRRVMRWRRISLDCVSSSRTPMACRSSGGPPATRCRPIRVPWTCISSGTCWPGPGRRPPRPRPPACSTPHWRCGAGSRSPRSTRRGPTRYGVRLKPNGFRLCSIAMTRRSARGATVSSSMS